MSLDLKQSASEAHLNSPYFFENYTLRKNYLLLLMNCVKRMYLPRDRNGLGVQRVEHPGSQTVTPVFSQPALASKDIFDPLGWHGNRQLINQPAALWSGPIVAELQAVGGTLTGCVCMRVYVSMWASSSF